MVSGRDPDSHYQPAVDGLRAVAIIGVYVFHLAPHLLPGGFTGVDVFFVISGYLITQVILRDKADGTFSFSRFYQRRIARIYPHLFFVAAITLLGSFAVYDDRDIGSAGALFAASVAGVANVKLMLQGNYFAISNDTQPYLHFWTLGLEEQFYLLHPFLVLGLTRLPRPWALGVWPALGFGSFLLCCEMTVSRPVWSFFLLPTRAWEFIVGVVLADAAARGSLKMTAASAAALMGAGLVLVFGSFAVLGENRMFPGPLAAIPVARQTAVSGCGMMKVACFSMIQAILRAAGPLWSSASLPTALLAMAMNDRLLYGGIGWLGNADHAPAREDLTWRAEGR